MVYKIYPKSITSTFLSAFQNLKIAMKKKSKHNINSGNSFEFGPSNPRYTIRFNPLGKIRHKNVIRRHDETRRRNDFGNWLYMKVSRTSFYVATFSRRYDNVVYVAMSSQRFYDVRDVKRRPANFHIQPTIQVLSTSGFDGRRLAEWESIHMKHDID